MQKDVQRVSMNAMQARGEAEAWDAVLEAIVRLSNIRRRLGEEGTLSSFEGAAMAVKTLRRVRRALDVWMSWVDN